MTRKKLFFATLLYAVACIFTNAQSTIVGPESVGMLETVTYKVDAEGATAMKWSVPPGFKITGGQGTEEITVRSTFLSQDGNLTVERQFSDGNKDNLSVPLSVYRKVSEVVDHSINAGETVTIAGNAVKEANIYYEQTGEEGGKPLYTAHRVTVIPENSVEYTRPILQTITESSVWVCWKTSKPVGSSVAYGETAGSLSQSEVGNYEMLGDNYYWHSVQLKGLKENTAYYYKINVEGADGTVFRFHTAPKAGSKQKMRILLMGDHQIKSRSGYEWLMQAAKSKIEELYGNVEDNVQMIMNVGDQVDLGTIEQYEQIHINKSALLSPYLPIMTAVGNHETYQDAGMANYAAHNHYEGLTYKGISSGTENYYAYQVGRVLFVVLSTEHTGSEQKSWVRKVVDEAKNDDSVDFIISVNHRPIQAEQYIGDISKWVRDEIVPILSETPKHILNYGGHHHLYHRGQLTEYPLYHIINGGASWDQLWGMSSEKDYSDVQKTIDYWGYQILELSYDNDAPQMTVDCYAIGNRDIVRDNILIDSFSRKLNQAQPERPQIESVPEIVNLPITFSGSEYMTTGNSKLNTVEYQISSLADFSSVAVDCVRDVEDFYGSTGKPLHIPIDVNENIDIRKYTINENELKNGDYNIRMRYRDDNLEWSEWSDALSFTVEGSVDGDPSISMDIKQVNVGKEFSVRYEYAPVGKNAWVGIYHKFDKPNATVSTKWAYTDAASGTITFTLDNADEYYAVLFKDGGYEEVGERIPFFVGSDIEFSTDKNVYAEGEKIVVTYSNAPALSDDWFGIYKMGSQPGGSSVYSSSWNYVDAGVSDGNMALGTGIGNARVLSKGYYFINYFTRGYYFEPYDRKYFSVGTEISSVSSDINNYLPGENVLINYANGPGTPKDWVGFYKEGKNIGTDELDGFFYTYGATDGTITIDPDKLDPADYFVALYINDSYDVVSNIIHLSIGKAPKIDVENVTDNEILLSFDDLEEWRQSITDIMVDGATVTPDSYNVEVGKITLTNAYSKETAHNVIIKAKGWQDNTVSIDATNGVNIVEQDAVSINLVDDVVNIRSTAGGTLVIYSSTGATLLTADVAKGNQNLSLSNIQSGLYIADWRGDDGVNVSKKIKLQ